MWNRDDIKTLLQVEPSHLAITFFKRQVVVVFLFCRVVCVMAGREQAQGKLTLSH